MRIVCPHCSRTMEISDAEVKRAAARIAGRGCSEAKRKALQENAKKPRKKTVAPE